LSKELRRVDEEPIVEVPIEALQTFREEYLAPSGIPKKMQIKHDFISIDQAVRYSILVLIESGYIRNIHFPERVWSFGNRNMKGLLDGNPVITGVRQGFYEFENARDWRKATKPPKEVFPWHEILIAPFTEHHERSLMLTFCQLGYTVGELQLWLEVQIKNINQTKDYIAMENKRIKEHWMKDNCEGLTYSDCSGRWSKFCYDNSPHRYSKYRQYIQGSTKDLWYNWRNYLHYDYWVAYFNHLHFQQKFVYQEIKDQPRHAWFMHIGSEEYVPYLFVNPEVELVQAKYILTEKAQKFLRGNTKLFPKLPEEVVEDTERLYLEAKYEVIEDE
jgi:hypothetical protein